ncbi:MAG: FkbM family methyltransferase [Verrucomicrobia bacterium]|nr:FkbM family methyltransferase [Verrucomicrobiota bacterium]
MKLDRIIHALTPPALAWRLGRAGRERKEAELFGAFYRVFLAPGDLCFDIGANLGNRTRCFRNLGCKVIAVEPQPACFHKLTKDFGGSEDIRLVQAAVGRVPGRAKLHLSPDHVLSTLSQAFIDETTGSGRFAAARWDREVEVTVTTLDELIAAHGMPNFIKIDVEGYESEVIAGLSQAVPALSIEYTPELPENARACLRQLASLGDYEFNLSWGESMRWSRPQWRTLDSMLVVIDEFAGENQLFGDIYARAKG